MMWILWCVMAIEYSRVFTGKLRKKVKGSSLALHYNVGISSSHDSWLPEEAYNQEVRGKYFPSAATHETQWMSPQCIVMTGGYQVQDNHRLNEERTVGERKSLLAKSTPCKFNFGSRFAEKRGELIWRYRCGGSCVDGRTFIIQTA